MLGPLYIPAMRRDPASPRWGPPGSCHSTFGKLQPCFGDGVKIFGGSFFTYSSEKLEKAGTVDFKKHPARKVGIRSRQCGPKVPGRFAFPGARNPRIGSISRFGKNFPAIFPGLSWSFPGEPPNRPRKQPQPSQVFWTVGAFFGCCFAPPSGWNVESSFSQF